jgi:hypothetical protein
MKKEITTVPREAIFCGKYPGIAMNGYFSSTAWLKGQEEFKQVTGRSFGWFDFEDQCQYISDKSQIRLMTLEEYKEHKPKFDAYYQMIQDLKNELEQASIEE